MTHVHKWNQNPPTKGRSWCIKCKQLYRGKGRPVQTHVDVDPLIEVASAMTGVLPVEEESPIVDTTASEKRIETPEVIAPTPAPVVPAVTPRWATWAAPKLTKLLLLLADQAGNWMKPPRKAKEPEQMAVDEFNEGFAEQLAVWMPNAELTPMKKMLLSGAAVVSSMYIGAEKVKPQENANAPVADSSMKQETKVVPIRPQEQKTGLPKGLL